MYTAIILFLLLAAALTLVSGVRRGNRTFITAGILAGACTFFFFRFMDFWGEYLWFESLGFENRFMTGVFADIFTGGAGAALGGIITFFLTMSLPRDRRHVRNIAVLAGIVAGTLWGYNNWEDILQFWYRAPAGISDPILEKDAGFYLFILPFSDELYRLLLFLGFISFLASFIAVYIRLSWGDISYRPGTGGPRLHLPLYVTSAFLFLLLGWGKYLDRFHLMYSEWGAVSGPGWTDVNVRLPAYDFSIALAVFLGLVVLLPPGRNILRRKLRFSKIPVELLPVAVIGFAGTILILFWALALGIIPGLFQRLRVEPNEITFEKPFIGNNISYTRYGFGLNAAEEKQFTISDRISPDIIRQNKNLFANVRLWDWRVLDAVYKQFQEMRLYYEFVDVDIDRYMIDGAYRLTMAAAREMEAENLPAQSQTFVNKRFKYTHGYGMTLTTVSEFTPDGLPNLLIKDIPPATAFPELEVHEPRIYYGEAGQDYVIVNTKEAEFDYPSGEQNVYNQYKGTGGVQLSNIWRKFLYGWKFDGTRLFFSGYPTAESRIMFHRNIHDRVRLLAPFLVFDNDPYIVLHEGRLYWIIDAYTVSENFPYSQPFEAGEQIEISEGEKTRTLATTAGKNFRGINYIRNSVKAVIDAYHGSVDFYIYDENDPIMKVWDRIYPGMFKKKEEMPGGLRQHVRYPADLLLIQGLIYAKYHMGDPAVFYNQEDLWIRATEKYYGEVRPVEPYYIIWERPGSDIPEFALILPFTPKNRQVLIGWIAGMCDGDEYGQFLAYRFPKERHVLGPQQVETKIDQDSFLSGQLTLWDQRGSKVIRGNLIAIPIENTLLYVEPIYLQAETAAFPELRLIAVMHQDKLSYAQTFEEAIRGLFETVSQPAVRDTSAATGVKSFGEDVRTANRAFEDYLRFSGEKRFGDAAKALEELEKALGRLSRDAKPAGDDSTAN